MNVSSLYILLASGSYFAMFANAELETTSYNSCRSVTFGIFVNDSLTNTNDNCCAKPKSIEKN